MVIDDRHRNAVRDFITDRECARREETAVLLQQARIDFARTVAMIVERYQPHEIWQWGSLIHPETFTAGSDIDIGLVGVSVRDHMTILRETEGTTCLPLHIARMEEIASGTIQLIYNWGRKVYPENEDNG